MVNASFMINKVVKSLAHVFKVRRLSGIADAMNLVPSKPITLPSVISPDEVLENNLAKEATSIYGSSQSSIIQIFGLFMRRRKQGFIVQRQKDDMDGANHPYTR